MFEVRMRDYGTRFHLSISYGKRISGMSLTDPDLQLFAGNLKSLNDLAKQARADHIIHTGDFGFYDETSLERIADK